MSGALTLGGVTFQDLEIPDEIEFGGGQMLAKHKLIGGQRMADAMGRDDVDPQWTGRFFGSDALDRCQAIDAMRIADAPVGLDVSTLSYSVLIDEFRWRYAADFNIVYSIKLFILADNSSPDSGGDDASVDDAMSSDMSDASDLSDQIGDDDVSTAVDNVQTAVSGVSSFGAASRAQINSVLSTIGSAQLTVSALATSLDASIVTGSMAGVVSGGTGMAGALLAQTQASQQLPLVSGLSNILGRMSKNLTSINTSGENVVLAGGNLYDQAAKAYGDSSAWVDIAQANGLTDPELEGLNTILIPPTQSNSDGVFPV